MNTTHRMKQGDRLPALVATLLNPDKSPMDLSDVTDSEFFMRGVSLTGTASIDTPNDAGIVRYAWGEGDTDQVGRFDAEFKLTWAGGAPQTVPNEGHIQVFIDEDLE